jgi:diketogulonate reductase-like aldo/keto reductase
VQTSYENQVEVGEGIARAFKEFGIKREDVFIVSCKNTRKTNKG